MTLEPLEYVGQVPVGPDSPKACRPIQGALRNILSNWTTHLSFPLELKGDVNKFAPRKALELLA